MNETRYLISETAKITQVEPHVLRYWEEELGLAIGRNEMGHRYYTDKDIQTFLTIKELKKKGLQLRAIRTIIQQTDQQINGQEIVDQTIRDPDIGRQVLDAKEKISAAQDTASVCEQRRSVIKLQEKRQEKKLEKSKEERFGEIMERLIHDIELDERKEGRYRRLDEAIRKHQQSRKMVAATQENAKRKSKRKVREKKSKEHVQKENMSKQSH
ncbi:MerR family transcriptional regulator [bacterium]|nr:MerR family transcriptional regulator [bacterium]MDY3022225.1 MerR family transcriptional regulator [Oliverpabstia sp.]